MKSLSGSEGDLGVAYGPSIGSALFGFILMFLMAAGVAVLEAAVLVIAWATRTAPVRSGKLGHSVPSVRMLGDNSMASG